MKPKGKSYRQESFECYIFISIFMLFFITIIMVSGQLAGADWLGYFKQALWKVS